MKLLSQFINVLILIAVQSLHVSCKIASLLVILPSFKMKMNCTHKLYHNRYSWLHFWGSPVLGGQRMAMHTTWSWWQDLPWQYLTVILANWNLCSCPWLKSVPFLPRRSPDSVPDMVSGKRSGKGHDVCQHSTWSLRGFSNATMIISCLLSDTACERRDVCSLNFSVFLFL